MDIKVPEYLSALRGKTLVLLDGSNLYGSTQGLGFDIDFHKLRTYFRNALDLVDTHFFATIDMTSEGKSRVIPFLDALEFGGYQVSRKEVHRPIQSKGRETIDVEIAVAALDAVETVENLRNIIIFSGNGDLESLVRSLRRRGIFVMIVSSAETNPPMSIKVRKAASYFVEIQEIITAAQAAKGNTLNPGFNRQNEFVPANG